MQKPRVAVNDLRCNCERTAWPFEAVTCMPASRLQKFAKRKRDAFLAKRPAGAPARVSSSLTPAWLSPSEGHTSKPSHPCPKLHCASQGTHVSIASVRCATLSFASLGGELAPRLAFVSRVRRRAQSGSNRTSWAPLVEKLSSHGCWGRSCQEACIAAWHG